MKKYYVAGARNAWDTVPVGLFNSYEEAATAFPCLDASKFVREATEQEIKDFEQQQTKKPPKMTIKDVKSTRQVNWKFENHCFGGCAIAAQKIAAGETIYFDVFNRPNKEDSTELKYKTRFYFGLVDIDGSPALRVSNSTNLEDSGTHSLIPSWNNQAADPVFIAARLTLFLCREGSDWFIEGTNLS